MRTITVDDDPHLLALTARAAVSRSRATTLPDVQLIRSGVLTEAGHLAAYSRVCGFDLTGVLPSTYVHVLAFPLQVTLMGRSAWTSHARRVRLSRTTPAWPGRCSGRTPAASRLT